MLQIMHILYIHGTSSSEYGILPRNLVFIWTPGMHAHISWAVSFFPEIVHRLMTGVLQTQDWILYIKLYL